MNGHTLSSWYRRRVRDSVEYVKTLPCDSVVIVVQRVILKSGTVLKCGRVNSTIAKCFQRA